MFKLKPIPSILPLPIREEWDRLQKVISEFSPANGQEEQVYQILERKLTELQGKSRLEISNSSAQVK